MHPSFLSRLETREKNVPVFWYRYPALHLAAAMAHSCLINMGCAAAQGTMAALGVYSLATGNLI